MWGSSAHTCIPYQFMEFTVNVLDIGLKFSIQPTCPVNVQTQISTKLKGRVISIIVSRYLSESKPRIDQEKMVN